MADWLTGYGWRVTIRVDQTYIDGDLTAFPLSVRLSNSTLLKEAAANGYDVRFTLSDSETLLKYERESWAGGDGSNVTANFWVRVPSIAATGDPTEIFCYFNKPGDTDGQDAANTWESGFRGVWHFTDTPNDSTTHAEHLTAVNSPAYDTGIVGKAVDLEAGSSQYLYHADGGSTDIFGANQPLTLEAWVKAETFSGLSRVILGKYDATASARQYQLYWHSNDELRFLLSADGSAATICTGATGVVDNGSWHHVVAVYDDTDMRIYVDGALDSNGSDNPKTYTAGIADKGAQFRIGVDYYTNYLDGLIDEARVSAVARSAAWIKFTYRNIVEADGEISWWSKESAPVAVTRPRILGGGIL